MPIPRVVAWWNRAGLNRVARGVAARAPGFAVVVHTGRRSGRTFQTPVNVFETPSGVRIALTYGAESDWVRNVIAADGCRLRTRGRVLALIDPRVAHDPARTGIGAVPRRVLGLLKVSDFLDGTVQPAP